MVKKTVSDYKKMYEMPDFTEYRSRRILELCEYLAPVMNKIHDTDYSYRFWATLLKTYAKTCVNRENLMSENILKTHPQFLPHDGWELPGLKDRWRIYLRYGATVLMKGTSIKNVHNTIKKSDHICIGLRAEYLEKYGVGTYCPDHYPVCLNFFGRNKRKKTLELSGSEGSVFLKNVIRQLPMFYVECFDQLIDKIELINPGDKTFHAEHISEFMEMMIAFYVEHGAKYYRYQYGGFVGETVQSVEKDRYIDIDRLRTYGWKINEKDEPFKAIRLEQFSKSYAKETTAKYDAVIVYSRVTNNSQKRKYKKASDAIFQNLDHNKFSNVLLRPRGFTKKKDNSGELAFLDIPFFVTVGKGKRPMAEIVKSSNLVIHLRHPSTNFLECIYVDHPVVALLTNSNPTEIIKPFYRFFLDEKVMHNNIESLVAHLNAVDLNTWWQEVVQKPKYKQFKHQFARKV